MFEHVITEAYNMILKWITRSFHVVAIATDVKISWKVKGKY